VSTTILVLSSFVCLGKGAISSVIQPKNSSHDPSSGPGTNVHHKEQDERSKGTK